MPTISDMERGGGYISVSDLIEEDWCRLLLAKAPGRSGVVVVATF